MFAVQTKIQFDAKAPIGKEKGKGTAKGETTTLNDFLERQFFAQATRGKEEYRKVYYLLPLPSGNGQARHCVLALATLFFCI